jgi:hypothetical protein
MHFSLKRLASTLGLSSQGESPVLVQPGWNGLPEDIFILILKDYLGVNSAAANSLSQTCRAYAISPAHISYAPFASPKAS